MGKLSSLRPPDPRQNDKMWSLRHIGFNRPDKHPVEIPRGQRGRALIRLGQVWVEDHTQHLFVIVQAKINEEQRRNLYNLDVVAQSYCGRYHRINSEAVFRQGFTIWDDAITEMIEAVRQLDMCANTDGGSPWQGRRDAAEQSSNFFGFDTYGFRIDN
ncbi:MAG: hypothetical protein AAGA35_03255 [Patescibacteria group bacterium]